MTESTYGHTASGRTIDDALVEKLAGEADAGYDVDKVIAGRGKPGRPTLGSGPSTIESVRLDPELKERLTRRAQADGVAVSEVIREALRQHLEAS